MKIVKNRAFTLIELLVSITIIALLTSVATASFLTAQKHSRDSARKASVNNISSAVEAYYMVNKNFPGKIDKSNTPTPATYINTPYLDCETLFTSGANNYFLYYYDPTPRTVCTTVSDANMLSGGYANVDFSPAPNWIPGLGPFINPIPIETRFQDTSGKVADILTEKVTKTLLYRKLNGGYMVYARLESSDDSDLEPTFDFGKLPSITFPVTGNINNTASSAGLNVYLVRK